jgi:hypothetical protein
MWSVPSSYLANWGDESQFSAGACVERTWAREAEESTLLRDLCQIRTGKDTAGCKGLAETVLICDLWRLAVAL